MSLAPAASLPLSRFPRQKAPFQCFGRPGNSARGRFTRGGPAIFRYRVVKKIGDDPENSCGMRPRQGIIQSMTANADAGEPGRMPVAARWRGRPGTPVSRGGAASYAARMMVVVGLAALGGCSTSNSHSVSGTAKTPATAASEQSKVDGDPLIRLVGTLPVAVDYGFREPATGETLRVRVLQAYAAASGRPCRQFVVVAPGRAEQHRLACEEGDRWVAARPLRLEPPDAAATRVQ